MKALELDLDEEIVDIKRKVDECIEQLRDRGFSNKEIVDMTEAELERRKKESWKEIQRRERPAHIVGITLVALMALFSLRSCDKEKENLAAPRNELWTNSAPQ